MVEHQVKESSHLDIWGPQWTALGKASMESDDHEWVWDAAAWFVEVEVNTS